MASRHLLVITIISVMAPDVHQLVASLSGDESNKKQRTPVYKKGSINPWSGHAFEFIVRELDTRVEFKFVKNTLGFKKVVGEVDVPVKDLLPIGCVGDMELKVLSLEVRSSSTKTKEETMGVLEFSYQFGERFPVEAHGERKEETVTANPAAAAPPESYTPPMPHSLMAYQQNAAPNYLAVPPPALNTAYQQNWAAVSALHHQTAYLPNATPTYFYGAPAGYGPTAPAALHPGGNFLGRLRRAVAVSVIMGAFNNLGFDGGDFTDAGFGM